MTLYTGFKVKALGFEEVYAAHKMYVSSPEAKGIVQQAKALRIGLFFEM